MCMDCKLIPGKHLSRYYTSDWHLWDQSAPWCPAALWTAFNWPWDHILGPGTELCLCGSLDECSLDLQRVVGVPSQLSSGERALCNGSLSVSLQALLSLVGLCTLAGAHQHGLLSGDTPGALCRDFRQVWLAFPSLQGLCQTPQSREKLTERGADAAGPRSSHESVAGRQHLVMAPAARPAHAWPHPLMETPKPSCQSPRTLVCAWEQPALALCPQPLPTMTPWPRPTAPFEASSPHWPRQ